MEEAVVTPVALKLANIRRLEKFTADRALVARLLAGHVNLSSAPPRFTIH